MSKSTDIRIVEATCSFESIPFRTPLKFGGRVVETCTLINVEVDVESRNGHMARGYGSMPLGNVWAWPTTALSIDDTEKAMRAFAEEVELYEHEVSKELILFFTRARCPLRCIQ